MMNALYRTGRTLSGITLAVAFLAAVGDLVRAEGWKAAAARAVITPDKPMWMAGYAARNRPAEGKLHDLWAKVLALQDPKGQRAVVVTLDLCGIDRQFTAEVCKALQEKHKLERSRIVLCVSHTHSGPVVERNLTPMYFIDADHRERVADYTAKISEQVIDIADKALNSLRPATLHWARGKATFAVNRRNNKEADVPDLRAPREGLRGPFDHEVPVLAVAMAAGNQVLEIDDRPDSERVRTEAILFGYACHATVLDGYDWSGDYPGYAQIELERRRPTANAMFVAGCGADQNPLPRRKVEYAEAYGEQLAAAVDEALRGPLEKIEGGLSTSYREIDLPFEDLPTREKLETDSESTNKYVANRAKLLLEKIDAGEPLLNTYPYPVQAWRFGDDLQVVWLAGEVVVDYSLRLKQDLPNGKAWIAGYANDVMAYIPSRRVLQEGGYEGREAMVYYGLPTAWSSEVEKLIVDEVQRQVR